MNNEEKILGMLETLTVDMNGMKADMNGMKADMNGMKADMNGMKADMAEVKDRLGNVEQSVDKIEKRLDNVEEHLAETRVVVKKTHNSVVVIENDHGDTLKYLRDGYTNITKRLGSIEDKVTYHDKILVGNVI